MSPSIIDPGLIDKIANGFFSRDANVKDKSKRDFQTVCRADKLVSTNPTSPAAVTALAKALELQKEYLHPSLAVNSKTTAEKLTPPAEGMWLSKLHGPRLASPMSSPSAKSARMEHPRAEPQPPTPEVRAKDCCDKKTVFRATKLTSMNSTPSFTTTTLAKAIVAQTARPQSSALMPMPSKSLPVLQQPPAIKPGPSPSVDVVDLTAEEDEPPEKRAPKRKLKLAENIHPGSNSSPWRQQNTKKSLSESTNKKTTSRQSSTMGHASNPDIIFVEPAIDEDESFEDPPSDDNFSTINSLDDSDEDILELENDTHEIFVTETLCPPKIARGENKALEASGYHGIEPLRQFHQSTTTGASLSKPARAFVPCLPVSSTRSGSASSPRPQKPVICLPGSSKVPSVFLVDSSDDEDKELESPSSDNKHTIAEPEKPEVYNLARSVRTDHQSRERENTKRAMMICRKCAGHGIETPVKAHGICPFSTCTCPMCKSVMRTRQLVMNCRRKTATLKASNKSIVPKKSTRNLAGSVRIDQQSREREKTRKTQLCRKCAGHGIETPVKAHGICPFSMCTCPMCKSVMRTRQSILKGHRKDARKMAALKLSNKNAVPQPDIWDEDTVYSYVLLDTNMSGASTELQNIIYAGITMNPSNRLKDHLTSSGQTSNYRKQHPTARVQMVVIGKHTTYDEASMDEFMISHMRDRLSLVKEFHPGNGAEVRSRKAASIKMNRCKGNIKRESEIASCVHYAVETANFVSTKYRVFCPTCGASYCRTFLLNRHIETHTGQSTKIQCTLQGCGGNVYNIYTSISLTCTGIA